MDLSAKNTIILAKHINIPAYIKYLIKSASIINEQCSMHVPLHMKFVFSDQSGNKQSHWELGSLLFFLQVTSSNKYLMYLWCLSTCSCGASTSGTYTCDEK